MLSGLTREGERYFRRYKGQVRTLFSGLLQLHLYAKQPFMPLKIFPLSAIRPSSFVNSWCILKGIKIKSKLWNLDLIFNVP